MDKIFSTRINEAVIRRIQLLAHQLHTTKKQVVEGAIAMYAEHVAEDQKVDFLDRTFGAWKRRESPEATISASRRAFRDSMTRRRT